jgi:hypothetical protein
MSPLTSDGRRACRSTSESAVRRLCAGNAATVVWRGGWDWTCRREEREEFDMRSGVSARFGLHSRKQWVVGIFIRAHGHDTHDSQCRAWPLPIAQCLSMHLLPCVCCHSRCHTPVVRALGRQTSPCYLVLTISSACPCSVTITHQRPLSLLVDVMFLSERPCMSCLPATRILQHSRWETQSWVPQASEQGP